VTTGVRSGVKSGIFLKLLLGAVAVIAVATLTVDVAIRRAWERSLRAEIEHALTEKTQLVALRIHGADNPHLRELATEAARAANARVTVIQRDGTVLADTEADPARMENHAARPEFASALAGRIGTDTRTSHTVSIEFLYVAAPIDGGAVRLAYPLAAVQRSTAQVRVTLLSASLIALLISGLLAAVVASRLSARLQRMSDFAERIAAGDLAARIDESSADEIGHLANALDRTARQLEATLAEAERVEKTRRDFIANVSHELRTPLTSITGYAETLLDSELPAASRREFVEAIHRNAARMARLTEDLLALAHVESGEQRLELEPVPPQEALREVVSALRERAATAGVTLELADGNAPAVNADRHALQQVLENLINNALRYAAEGKRVVVGATAGGDAVEFYVRDFGPGIAARHLARVFERFYRADKDRSRETGGTGLGLAIVKHLVLNQGGTVRAESTVREGTTFYFTLPIAQSPN
jgi:two-component system phosphate regulon sensor histidine kinase PhoR